MRQSGGGADCEWDLEFGDGFFVVGGAGLDGLGVGVEDEEEGWAGGCVWDGATVSCVFLFRESQAAGRINWDDADRFKWMRCQSHSYDRHHSED